MDDWNIDLGLLGSQKALSLPPDLAMVTVSEKAWDAIASRRYDGYDALLPWLFLANGYGNIRAEWMELEDA